MKIWLDDCRPAPEGWTLVRTVQGACVYLLSGGVTEISLDHDLGEFEAFGGEGIKVIDFMAEFNIWPVDGVHLHTANPVARDRMRATLNRYSPYLTS